MKPVHVGSFQHPPPRTVSLFMSDTTDTNPNEDVSFITNNVNDIPRSNEPSTVTTTTTTTSTGNDLSLRTSSVFLLEPNDPSASLSASPYTFPSPPQQRPSQQTILQQQSNTGGNSNSNSMNPNTASMLLVTSSSSSVSSATAFVPPPPEPIPLPSIEEEMEQPLLSIITEEIPNLMNEINETRMEMTTTDITTASTMDVDETTITTTLLINEELLAATATTTTTTMEVPSDASVATTTETAPETTDMEIISSIVVEESTLIDESLEVPRDGIDDSSDVVVPELPDTTTTTTSTNSSPTIAMDEPNETTTTAIATTIMSEDQKVINDLFIINDVFGVVDPITSSSSTSTTATMSPMESDDIELEVLESVMTDDTMSNVVSIIEEENIHGNIKDIMENDADIHVSTDLPQDLYTETELEPSSNVVVAAVAAVKNTTDDTIITTTTWDEEENMIETTNDETISTISDSVVDWDDDRIVVNDLFEILEDNNSNNVANTMDTIVDHTNTKEEKEEVDTMSVADAAVVNEVPAVVMEEDELSIEPSNIDIVPTEIPLTATTANTLESNGEIDIEPETVSTVLELSEDDANVNSNDYTNIVINEESPSVVMEEACMEVSPSFVEESCDTTDPLNNINVDDDHEIDFTLLEEVNSETNVMNEMTMYDEDIDNTVIDEYTLEISVDDTNAVFVNDSIDHSNDIIDNVEENVVMEPTLMNSVPRSDTQAEPFFLRYEDDDEVASNELIVRPPVIPPQLSHFVGYQQSIVVAMTREERITLAERSIISLEVKPGVKADTIKGAAIATFVLALLAGDELPVVMFGMVPAVSYFAITRGKTGETIRIIGDISWLWTAKFTETLSTLDASQLISFWNTIQSITSKFSTSFGEWIAKQSALAQEEYYQKQFAATNINTPHPPNNVASEYYFLTTSDQQLEENVPVPPVISQLEQTYEKELEDIRLLLEEADRERIAAQLRCKQKATESNQRRLFIAKLDMDRRSAHAKQLIRDGEDARLKIEKTMARRKLIEANQRALLERRLTIEHIERARFHEQLQELTNKKMTEAKQRSLLEARLRFDREYMAIVNEAARLASEASERMRIEAKQRSLLEYRLSLERQIAAQVKVASQQAEIGTRRKMNELKQRALLENRLLIDRNQKRLRVEKEALMESERLRMEEAELVREEEEKRQTRIDEQARMEEEIRLAEQSRIEELARIEEENRRLEEANLLTEMEALAKIEAEKRRIEAAERTRLARIEKQARLEEESRIADLSKIENENRQTEEEGSPVVEDKQPQTFSKTEKNNQPSNAPMTNLVMNLEYGVSTGELPWADSGSMRDSSTTKPLEVQKPNLDAAKALLESVRRGETYQFKKEWWE